MNDCIWFSIYDCNGHCGTCRTNKMAYLSINSEEGSRIYQKYNDLVEEAIKPIGDMIAKEHLDVTKIPMKTNVEV